MKARRRHVEKVEEDIWPKIGIWSFALGLVVALLVPVFYVSQQLDPTITWFLGILGIVAGILNVGDHEVNSFLLASLTFMIGALSLQSVLAGIPQIGGYFPLLLKYVSAFVAPGAAIVALKALYNVQSA